jgi:hypothetical protein
MTELGKVSLRRYEVLTAMKLSMAMVWFVAPCGLADGATNVLKELTAFTFIAEYETIRSPKTLNHLQVPTVSYRSLNVFVQYKTVMYQPHMQKELTS